MTQSDIIYRAFGELYNAMQGDSGTAKIIGAIAKAKKPETITVTHNVCHVETDWLDAIERGLVFIGRAIDEDRQFIRSEGEVKPIEKVRRISKESVQHLSRHSDLITREQKEDIVPDKLYTVERDSDYAVYENKFLYLLLCRVRDFVNVRYEAIVNAYKEYRGEYEVTKRVETATRRMNIAIKLSDEQDDAISAPADSECAEAINRIDKIRQSVSFYLRTPLMLEVSHSPKIGTKITKTNVLMMNKNFHEALILYEYLLGYEEDGFTIERKVETPDIPEFVMHELAVPALLSAFLVYEHGLGLQAYLQSEYEKEEARRAEEAQKEILKKLKALKKRIEETGEGAEQYMLMLEERNAVLEKNFKLLQEAREKIAELEQTIEKLRDEIGVMQREIDKLNAEKQELIEEMKRAEEEHKRQIEQMIKEFEEKTAALEAAHAEELERERAQARQQYDELKRQSEEQIASLKEAQAAEIEVLKAAQRQRLEDIQAEYRQQTDKIRQDCDNRIKDSANRIKESEARVQNAVDNLGKTQGELSVITKERDVLSARLTAVRREHGLLTEADDFTTEEGFNALEHEFEVLGKMVREEWTDVKRILKKEFYGGIRAAMHTKKPKKSKEYVELCQHVKGRNGGDESEFETVKVGGSENSPQAVDSADDIRDESDA